MDRKKMIIAAIVIGLFLLVMVIVIQRSKKGAGQPGANNEPPKSIKDRLFELQNNPATPTAPTTTPTKAGVITQVVTGNEYNYTGAPVIQRDRFGKPIIL